MVSCKTFSVSVTAMLVSMQVTGKAGAYFSFLQARDRVHPRQVIYLTVIHMGNLEKPVDLICWSLDCGRKLEHLKDTCAGMGRTCTLHTEGFLVNPGIKPCCEVPLITTAPLCCISCALIFNIVIKFNVNVDWFLIGPTKLNIPIRSSQKSVVLRLSAAQLIYISKTAITSLNSTAENKTKL